MLSQGNARLLQHLSTNLSNATICNPQAARGRQREVEDAARTHGPRSVIRTTTDLFVSRSMTRTLVPNGRWRCAAVSRFRSNDEPLAVLPLEYE